MELVIFIKEILSLDNLKSIANTLIVLGIAYKFWMPRMISIINDTIKPNNGMTMMTMGHIIKHYCEELLKCKKIHQGEMEWLDSMFSEYKKNGGNGTAETKYNAVVKKYEIQLCQQEANNETI